MRSLPSHICHASRWFDDRGISSYLSLQAALLLEWKTFSSAEGLAKRYDLDVFSIARSIGTMAAMFGDDFASDGIISTLL